MHRWIAKPPTAFWIIAIYALAILAYLPVRHAGFIWDDDSYVTNNALLHEPGGLTRIWFEPGATAQYYPLVFTTFWIEHHIWGPHPLGYHLVNVLLHATSAVLLGFLLTRLSVPGAWLAAILFAVHPVEVESVAWITERKNVLSGVCYLGAALAYLRFAGITKREAREYHDWPFYAAALVLFGAALLSKTVTASLPAALLLVLWYKRGRVTVRDLAWLAPLFVAGLILSSYTAWLEKTHVGAEGATWDLTWLQRCLIAGRALWFYAGKIVWPHPLIFNYPKWTIDALDKTLYLYPIAALAVIALLWCLRHRIGRGPLVAVLVFAGTLTPALGFFDVYPFRFSWVADHFQYHASIALIVLITGALATIMKNHRSLLIGVSTALTLTLAVLTFRQAHVYRNRETLWTDTLAKNPDSWMAVHHLGNLAFEAGHLEQARQRYARVLEMAPWDPQAQYNYGAILHELSQNEAAVPYLREAIKMRPDYAKAHKMLAIVYAALGKLDPAVKEFDIALQINPNDAEAHRNIAQVLDALGRHAEAAIHRQQAQRLEQQPTS
jgi:tetratricopeptide (TPR) repeat protein